MVELDLVVLIDSSPTEKSTLVFSATFTSDLFALLMDSTSTCPTDRLRRRAPGRLGAVNVAVIDSGVAIAGTTIPLVAYVLSGAELLVGGSADPAGTVPALAPRCTRRSPTNAALTTRTNQPLVDNPS
ncbi:hypothetical protein ACFP2T_47325 [Plantactinospora solaniradicis]|uniref:Uncharacterized protein n=1 Tax=Plantactinospora solaniradicis TaxID=1723736 RepID=A0ABW1KUD7_9ACTN